MASPLFDRRASRRGKELCYGGLMRRFLADTFALMLFSTVAGTMTEMVIVGLAPSQVLRSRLAALPVVLITARPYGLYRDWLFERFGSHPGEPLKAAAVDIVAFVSFQAPVYGMILLFAGATLSQAAAAITTAVVVLIVSGRPYGLLLEWSRWLFGVAAL